MGPPGALIRERALSQLPAVQVGAVSFDRQGVANHAKQLVDNVRGNLRRSLESQGVARAPDA